MSEEIAVYEKQNVPTLVLVKNDLKNPEKKCLFYKKNWDKHYISKMMIFSNEALKKGRVNYPFPMSLEEIESLRNFFQTLDLKNRPQIFHILFENEKTRLVIRSSEYGYELRKQTLKEKLPERDYVNAEDEEREDFDASNYPVVQYQWEDDFGSFFVGYKEDKDEYIKGMTEYLTKFRQIPPAPVKNNKRKLVGAGSTGKTKKNKKEEECQEKEEGLNKIYEILKYMYLYDEKDVTDLLQNYGEIISDDLKCEYHELIQLIRNVSVKKINDVFNSNFTEIAARTSVE